MAPAITRGTNTRGTIARARLLAVLLVCALALGCALVLAGCGSGAVADKVVLQLNWFHEAEFVGYYMADAKGFYQNQGLEVEIREGGPGNPARDKVVDGNADFAITSFAEQVQMVQEVKPVQAVAAIFQIPPLVIFALEESGIHEPSDLEGKRVGVTTGYWKAVLRQTLDAAGVDPGGVTEVDVKVGEMGLLYDRTVDAWLGYAQDEPIQAEVAGHPVSTIYPADYGIGGYEGLIIANETTLAGKAEMVKRFVKASIEGWRYALEHADEAAQVLDKWAPQPGLEFQKLAVRAVVPLVDTPGVPVGWIAADRWRQLMGDAFDAAHPGYTMEFSPSTP